MNYNSTRDNTKVVSSSEAIRMGISPEGGLFVPVNIPWLSYADIQALSKLDYAGRAAEILSRFLTDYLPEELNGCIRKAYTRQKFETDSIAPLYPMDNSLYVLELWHGPTCAFKDMALQLLPGLLTTAIRKHGDGKTAVILVATSGDTGKAALEGFKDIPGTKILVFYPQNGVSAMQKLQMTTQEGQNVGVCAIKGNFDDAQRGAKAIFTDREVTSLLEKNGCFFSSANSINWGRLAPQIVYYTSAYCDLLKNEKISCGEFVNVVVPTGNFGNILAAYYAKKMGIPIKTLICASNSNNVLTEFINTGVYNKDRPFYTTLSPSMDILVSSNLERLLYDLSGCDDKKTSGYMESLKSTGSFHVEDEMHAALKEQFWAGWCDDEATKRTIHDIQSQFSYVCDPHTAVAMNVYQQYRKKTGDTTKTIVASTASPFKFPKAVLAALGVEPKVEQTDFEALEELSKVCLQNPPKQIISLKEKNIRFSEVSESSGMEQYLLNWLGIENSGNKSI